MEEYFGLLVIALTVSLAVAILGLISVHLTTRKYAPEQAGLAKALALTLVSFVGSGMFLSLAMKLTDDKPGPFGHLVPTQIFVKILGAVIAWIVAMFGTWHLTKKMYATNNRQTTNIAWQFLCIISLYFGITVWKLTSWMVQTSGYR